jgi:hypothetical protein
MTNVNGIDVNEQTLEGFGWPKWEAHGFPVMADILPEVDLGTLRIEHWTMTPQRALFLGLEATRKQSARDYTPPGRYVKLLIQLDRDDPDYKVDHDGWAIMMSDTLAERIETRRLLDVAKGRVLVAGLGLGMLVHGLIRKEGVASVTVLEHNPLVIEAVGPTLAQYPNVRIVETDAREWGGDNPDEDFDTVLLDIWPYINETMHEELAEMRFHYEQVFPNAHIEGWLERELNLVETLWAIVEESCGDARRAGANLDLHRAMGMLNRRFNDLVEEAEVRRMLGVKS